MKFAEASSQRLLHAKKMNVISHRGYWISPEEKNTRVAFERSFACGFGTETDIRDVDGGLVISHDPPTRRCMRLEEFFELYGSYDRSLPLALNIKADGLQAELSSLLKMYQIQQYFVFDMAVPDGLLYARNGMNVYTRQSEHEVHPSLYSLSQGIWLDEFEGHWITDEVIAGHLQENKAVCIVSPELHRREKSREWLHYKELRSKICLDKVTLCTDHPEEARRFFVE